MLSPLKVAGWWIADVVAMIMTIENDNYNSPTLVHQSIIKAWFILFLCNILHQCCYNNGDDNVFSIFKSYNHNYIIILMT